MKLFIIFSVIFAITSARAQTPKLILPVGHIGGVYEAIFSPDYKYILTRDHFEVARLWDAQTGYLIANLTGHTERIYVMAFSQDGTKFFTAGLDGKLIIWNTKNAGKKLQIIHKAPITSAAFNSQGDLIVTGYDDKTAGIWNVNTGKQILSLDSTEHESEVVSAMFNKRGNMIRTKTYHSKNYWDAKTGKLLAKTIYNNTLDKYFAIKNNTGDTTFLEENFEWASPKLKTNRQLIYSTENNDVLVTDSTGKKTFTTITGHTNMVGIVNYSVDGDTLNAEPDDKAFTTKWDVKTMQLIKTIFFGQPRPNVYRGDKNKNVIFNIDRSLAAVIQDKNFTLWNGYTGIKLPQFKDQGFSSNVRNIFFSRDNKFLISIIYDDPFPASVWDIASGKLITKLPFDKDEMVTAACFSDNNKLAALFATSGTIKIFDLEKNNVVTTINTGVGDKVHDVIGGGFSTGNKMVFFNDAMANFKVYDLATREEIFSSREPGSYVRAATFTPDGGKMLLSTSSSLIKMVDLETKKELYHFFPVDSTDYFTQIPSGYYMATPGAAKLLHYVTPDLKVITFEQLDIKYNRPDKVLEGIGSTDTDLIRSYRRAYEKRIKKLGIDTTSFREGYSVPQTDFLSRNNIRSEQTEKQLSLHILASDSAYRLDKFNVWVNEVPVFGLKGINILRHKSNFFDTTISIALSEGGNRIETSVLNENGTESYRSPLQVSYNPAIPKTKKTYFIGIGINNFADAKYNLTWSVKDIRDLAKKFKEKDTDIIIDTLFNEQVTVANVRALRKKLLLTTEDDKVIIAYSGHGLLSKEYDYYLSTYNINFLSPEKNGLSYDDLESLLDNIAARKKLMLIDACHSGEVDKDELKQMVAVQIKLDPSKKGVIELIDTTAKKIGIKNSFELMQEVFTNVGKSTGATIISAASGTQFALERGDLKNGVFTFSLLEAMNQNKKMQVSLLKQTVAARVVELTNGKQRPTSRNETLEYDWYVW